jgi:hypothetical protein
MAAEGAEYTTMAAASAELRGAERIMAAEEAEHTLVKVGCIIIVEASTVDK